MVIRGTIFNIQRFSIHDGPGIRTTVFFKGCSLHCFWCHNPEGIRFEPEHQFYAGRCIACGACVAVCPQGAQELNGSERVYHRENCTTCGRCLNECFAGALEPTGREVSVAEVMADILADQPFYTQTGGGVTLSGGEPLLQFPFAQALLTACKAAGLHTALETAANYRWERLEALLPLVDLVMMDLKHLDSAKHRAVTGAPNERILENACRLAQAGKPLIFRTPVVPTVNDTPAEIEAIARFVAGLAASARADLSYELLPFHRLAADKYQSLGLDYRASELDAPSAAHMAALSELAIACGAPLRA